MPAEPATLPALLRERRRARGAAPFMVTDADTLTYDALDTDSRRLARRLVAAGVGKGARVGLLAPNGSGWAVTAMAVMRTGAVLVPLSTLLRPPELEAQLRTAGVTALVSARRYRGRRYLDELDAHVPGLAEVGSGPRRHPRLPSLQHLWADDALPDDEAPDAVVAAMEEVVRPADDLVVVFTSGSRGTPKGVVHTHGGAIRATAAGLPIRCIGAGDRLYIPMPFFWIGGFGGGLLSALVAGATLLAERDPTPAGTIAFLARTRATLFRGWPDQAARIAAHPDFATADLSSLRAGSLDAVLPPARRGEPGARANLFGMTETFGPYAGFPLDTDLPPGERGTCGRPFGSIEVRVVDPGTGVPVPAGTPGVIEVRGPDVLRAICGRTRPETFGPDGFYPTGDLGTLDAEGFLSHLGRVDDMVKVSGATVYPSEVEAALRAIDFVGQAHVTDVAGADGRPVLGAVVTVTGPRTAADLDRAARRALSSFKVPRRWVVVASADAVPVLASGKVDKAGLQALVARQGVGVEG